MTLSDGNHIFYWLFLLAALPSPDPFHRRYSIGGEGGGDPLP